MGTDIIKVTIFTQTGDEFDVETPLDIKASEFIDQVVLSLKLPKTDADGRPISWRMDDKETAKTLEGDKTLGDNGVGSEHRLILMRVLVAGYQANG